MEWTSKCRYQIVEAMNLSGAKLHDVDLSASEFNCVDLSKTRFHNIDLADVLISAVQMGGARFLHVGLPPGTPGRQRPMHFAECDLNSSSFDKCDFSNATLRNCELSGMTINGIAVDELLGAYERSHRRE